MHKKAIVYGKKPKQAPVAVVKELSELEESLKKKKSKPAEEPEKVVPAAVVMPQTVEEKKDEPKEDN